MTPSDALAIAAPLAGYRVLDMTTFLSGPFCTQILADLGAEIIKLESPEGDSSRDIPPHFVGNDSAYFLGVNRGKRSVSVDMKQPAGLDIVRRLIGKVDVVVENFRPGVVPRIGLDINALRAAHPGLIWASISGFGQTGPWRDLPAYDMIVQALSGVMSLTGEPGRPAVRLGIPAGDLVAGMYTAIAINAALAERERSGAGRVIDVSMLDCQLAMLSYQSTYALVGGVMPQPQGARHDSIPTYRSFVAGDGRELVITANTERMWRGLCTALGLRDLPADPRFASASLRLENRAALWPLLEQAFLQRNAAEWIAPLAEEGVPVALIKTVPEALADARDGERDMIQPLVGDEAAIEVVGNPIKFMGGRPAPAAYPPALGADTNHVLMNWLGMDGSQIARLGAQRVLRTAGDTQ